MWYKSSFHSHFTCTAFCTGFTWHACVLIFASSNVCILYSLLYLSFAVRLSSFAAEFPPAESILVVLAGRRLCRSQQCALVAQRANPIPGCTNPAWPVGQERAWSCCSQRWCSLTRSVVCSAGPHSLRRMWRSLNATRGEQQSWWQGWKARPVGSGWGLWAGPVWRKGGWGRCHCSLQLPEEGTGRGRCWALLPGVQWWDVWEWFKAAPG